MKVDPCPLVSLIIPMFNCADYIVPCLESVSRQRHERLEVILVDDCSQDHTLDLCRTSLDKDQRFNLIRADKNGGPGRARRMGLDVAKGDFILFLDADDLLEDDAVDTLVAATQRYGADMVVSAFEKVDIHTGTGTIISHFEQDRLLEPKALCDYAIDYMLAPGRHMMFSYCWGRLYRASIFKKNRVTFRDDLRICEDVLLNFEFLQHAGTVAYVNTPTYHYRFGRPESAAMAFSINGREPLLFYRDIWAAYLGILHYVGMFGVHINPQQLDHCTRYGHISHAIALLVRACGCTPKQPLLDLVHRMVHDDTVAENLRHYAPMPGQSRMIPWLLKFKLVLPLIVVCRYKYRKRYVRK